MSAKLRPSLLQRALGVFVVLALSLGAFLWAGKTLIQRHVERVQLDTHRMAALRTFERAIVPLSSLADATPPSAELVKREFLACSDPLKEQQREIVSERERRMNPCASSSQFEELACHLRVIDSKLAEMGGNGRTDRERTLNQTYAVSVERWTKAIRATQAPPDPAAPTEGGTVLGDKLLEKVSCHDAMAAARQLTANDGRLLTQLAWRDLTPKKVAMSAFAPDQMVKVTDQTLAQRNPWGGVPGCVYLGDGDADGRLYYVTDRRDGNRSACTAMRPRNIDEKNLAGAPNLAADAKLAAGDAAWTVPDSLAVMLADLDNVRLPGRDLYRAYTEQPKAQIVHASMRSDAGIAVAQPHGPNELERQKHKVEVGFNVHLTIKPETQRVVQQVSRCYAGDKGVCQLFGLDGDRKFTDFTKQMYEGAAVRMAAVAVIDIASGKIEALGSANSDCFRQEYDGPGRNQGQCPDLPTTPHYEPDRLLNHALYTDALPASTIKPIMAVGFLHDAEYRKKILADHVGEGFTRLQDELKSSDSAAFLDRLFCKDKGWTNCHRADDVQQAATLMGWDASCAEPSFRCGRLDVLFGVPGESRVRPDATRAPLGASVIYGRLMTEPVFDGRSADFRVMHDFTFDAALAAGCSRGDHYFGDSKNRAWRKCRQGHFSNIEHEGWGQGNARATTVGAAGMLARLAAAASGQQTLRLPYLVDRMSDAHADNFDLAARQFHLADPVKLEIPQADAAFILAGMVSHKPWGVPKGTRSGTAYQACARVFDAACGKIDWIAGKTGTPPYGNDDLTLAAIKKKCDAVHAHKLEADEVEEWEASCSNERPYKWYVAVFQTDPGKPGFNKAIAVLTERNWYKSGPQAGKVHSPGDHDDLNVSAEMAFRIMARLRGGSAEAKP